MMLNTCIILFLIQLTIAFVLQLGKQKNTVINEQLKKESTITILVPFHNEYDRISGLLFALNKISLPKNFEVLFIDDYSTDQTVELIQKQLKIKFQIIKNSLSKGKKFAIKQGVDYAVADYILTLDADVTIDQTYIHEINNLNKSCLNVLPVSMVSNNWIGRLAKVEFKFLDTLNGGLAKFQKPVIAYGANLLFERESFLAVEDKRTDYAIPSGDDIFLLQAMLGANKSVNVFSSRNLEVETDAPRSLKSVLQQRKRWFGKMGSLFEFSSLAALILLVLVQVFGVLAIVMSFFNPLFLLPLLIKVIAEIVATWKMSDRFLKDILTVFIHQLYYPFYCLLLLIPIESEEKWKTI